MDWLLVGIFFLLLEGETASEISKKVNGPPILQRLVLSDVSNIQLRRSYFGAAPEMAGASNLNSGSKTSKDKDPTDPTAVSTSHGSETRDVSDSSSSSGAGMRKQFEDYFRRDGVQFANVNPEGVQLAGNSSETPLDHELVGLNVTTNEPVSFRESSTAPVRNETLFPSTANSEMSYHTQMTDIQPTINNTDAVSMTTAANSTSSPTTCPICNPCPDYPGLIAGLVVVGMLLVVLIFVLLSLYCKRLVLTCASMCRCTKYTLV